MRVLLAFDKFKDSLTAPEACEFAAHALRERHPDWTLDLCPLADGGEGFCSILTSAAGGQSIATSVSGPRGDLVQAPIGIVSLDQIPAAARAQVAPVSAAHAPGAKIAIIEMAAASGLALLDPADRDPWQTTTFGTGELIRTAAELGAKAIVLGVGGSATHDLGLGALAALGLEFRDSQGRAIDVPIPARWREVARLAGRVPPAIPPIRIACDVTNPLLGARGAAAVYGPQKGLRPADLDRLDHESARLAMMLCAHCQQSDALMDAPGAGAAGGISFGLMVAAQAQLLPGFDLVSAWLDLATRVAAADLVITGEGRFDDSSLDGKGPGAVAARALALGKPVHVFAGQIGGKTAFPDGGENRGRLTLHAITPAGTPLSLALSGAGTNLLAAVRSVL
jgi:glycerate 2-kinase